MLLSYIHCTPFSHGCFANIFFNDNFSAEKLLASGSWQLTKYLRLMDYYQ